MPRAAFIMGFPRTSRTPEGIPIGGIRQWRTGFYAAGRLAGDAAHDDDQPWPAYDKNLPPKDINGVSRTLRFDLDPRGPVLWPEAGEVVDELLSFNKQRGWAPRLGFAYQMTDRAGVPRAATASSTWRCTSTTSTRSAPTRRPRACRSTNPTTNPIATIAYPFPCRARSHEPDLQRHVGRGRSEPPKTATTRTGTLPSATEFSRAAVVEVRYVGAKGSNLDTSLTNFNSPDPDPNAGSIPLQSRRPYPACGRIRMWMTDGGERLSLAAERVQAPRAVGIEHDRRRHTLSKLNDNQQGGLNASRARRQNPRSLEGEMRALRPTTSDIASCLVTCGTSHSGRA